MRSQPTMLHVRMSSTEVVLGGERVPLLRLIERVGAGWGKSRIDALCTWPGAAQFVTALAVGDSVQAELHDLHAHEGDMRGVIRHPPVLLPRATPARRAQLSKQEQPHTEE